MGRLIYAIVHSFVAARGVILISGGFSFAVCKQLDNHPTPDMPAEDISSIKIVASNPNGAAVATRILRLDEVATANREPDFFELPEDGVREGPI